VFQQKPTKFFERGFQGFQRRPGRDQFAYALGDLAIVVSNEVKHETRIAIRGKHSITTREMFAHAVAESAIKSLEHGLLVGVVVVFRTKLGGLALGPPYGATIIGAQHFDALASIAWVGEAQAAAPDPEGLFSLKADDLGLQQ